MNSKKAELLALAHALDNLPTPEGFITDVEEAADALREYAATMDAEPVAWIDSNGHPHHLSAIQGVREKQLYGPWRPLYD